MEYHYLYQIISLVPDENGVCKIYSGVRTSKVEPEIDDYFGSGRRVKAAVKKHGRDKFIKIIVAKFDTRLEADIYETQWLEKLFYKFYGGDWRKFGKHHYNLKLNVRGREGYAVSDETRKIKSEQTRSLYASGWKNGTYGVPVPDERRARISETLKGKMIGEKNPFYGKLHTAETRLKQSEVKKGQMVGEQHPMFGRAGKMAPNFKGIVVGVNISTKKVIIFDGEKSMKARNFGQSSVSLCLSGKYKHHKNFTFTRTTDEEYLRQLLEEDNFFDEQSKTIVQNFLQ